MNEPISGLSEDIPLSVYAHFNYTKNEVIKFHTIDLDETSSLKIKYRQKFIDNMTENQITSITVKKSLIPLFASRNIAFASEPHKESVINPENDWIDNFSQEEMSDFDMVFDMNFYIPPKKRETVKIKITSIKKATPPVIGLEDI